MKHESGVEKWILYSTCDEDAVSELRALDIGLYDDVLSVTGSACRTLSLMAKNPRSITSVDYAAGQNYLLELKLAAMRSLEYDELLAFLGVDLNPSLQFGPKDRWNIFTKLAPGLSHGAVRYFSYYRKETKSGILFRGRHEKFYIRYLSPFLHFLYGDALRKIFSSESIESQRKIYFNEIRGPLWKLLITKGFTKSLLKRVLNNPDYECEFEVPDLGMYMLETLDHTFSNHLAKDSDWLSLMLNGRYMSTDALPHFLTRDSYNLIRSARTEINLVTKDLVEFSKGANEDSFSKFSLSDVSSCISKKRFNELLHQVSRISRADGRLCYRNFIARHMVPSSLTENINRDDEMCDMLNNDDKAFSYKFEVAVINPSEAVVDSPRVA